MTLDHTDAPDPAVDSENEPFSEAIREAEIRRAVRAAVGHLDPPPASADRGVLQTYFAAANEVVDSILAFDERAAAYAIKRAGLLREPTIHLAFSREAAIRLWRAISTCLDEIEDILRLGESPDQLAIMFAKAQAVHDLSHWIDALYREKAAYHRLELEKINSRDKRTPKTARSLTPRRRTRAKRSLQKGSEAKLIACLAHYHGYETDAVNCEPMKSSALARHAGVSEATVSRFMSRFLNGSDGYHRLCGMGPEAISGRIRRLYEEYFEGKRLEGDAPE